MVEDVAGERLSARPGEGPERRRQTHLAELLLGLLPDRHGLVGEAELDLGDERGDEKPGVGENEVAPGALSHPHIFQRNVEMRVKKRRAVFWSIVTFSARRRARSSAPSLCVFVRSRSIASICR